MRTIDHHAFNCSQPKLKTFMQIMPYYEGSMTLSKIWYCPECLSYKEQDSCDLQSEDETV